MGPRKRVRKRSLELQLEQALRDAEAAMQAEPSELAHSKIKLAQTRIVVLQRALARERNDKLKQALDELEVIKAENERLMGLKREAELAAKPANTQVTQADEIDRVLAKYEQEKRQAAKNSIADNIDDEVAAMLQRIKTGGTEVKPLIEQEPVGPRVEEIEQQERERIAALEERSRQQELQRKRDALDRAERSAQADRENAELDAKLAQFGPKYYTPCEVKL